MIMPASIRYLNELATAAVNLKSIGHKLSGGHLDDIVELVKNVQGSLIVLEAEMGHTHDKLLAEAKHACYTILPLISTIRRYVDELEGYVADDLWPLPTYQEMLFIK